MYTQKSKVRNYLGVLFSAAGLQGQTIRMDIRKRRRFATLTTIIFSITGEAQKWGMRFLEEFYNKTKVKKAYFIFINEWDVLSYGIDLP